MSNIAPTIDNILPTLKLLGKSIEEYELQVDQLRDDRSELQLEYCSKAQAVCWNYLYSLKMVQLSDKDWEKFPTLIADITELDDQLQALEAKYYQILIEDIEKLIEKKEASIKQIKKIEDFL